MSTYFCLIPSSDRKHVLLLEEVKGWTLPHTEHEGFYDDALGWFHLHLQHDMRRQLGLYVTTLRHLTPTLCEMECRDLTQNAPLGSIWVSLDELASLTFAVPEHVRRLESWFTEDSGANPSSVPWEQVGWFDEAATWLRGQLTGLGYTPLAEVEQVKLFVFGTVLRLQTDSGYFYFKALLPTVQNEPALILELAKTWSAYLPEVVASDLERRWLLMRDFGGEAFTDLSSAHYETMLQTYARIQLSYADDNETWLQLGCPDRRLEKLPALFAEVIAAAQAGDTRVTAGLTDAQLTRLPDLLTVVLTKCQQLAKLAVPATLVQQDFQWSNIVIKEEGFVFFDWQDTVVSHPFFSMTRFLDYVPVPEGVDPFSPTLEQPADVRRRELRDAYLKPWQVTAPMNILQEAFALSRELHLPYLAVRWFRNLNLFESEGDEAVAWALGQLLRDRPPT